MRDPSSSTVLAIAIVGVLLYVTIYPILQYGWHSLSPLAPQVSSRVNVFNAELLLQIFRVLFAAASALSPTLTLVFAASFVLLFGYAIVRTPVFCYRFERVRKAAASAVAFVCLCRLFNTAFGVAQGAVLIEIIGIPCFAALVEVVADWRVRKVLSLDEPTVHQIKLLLGCAGRLEETLPVLEEFVFRHHKQCSNVLCSCRAVVEHLTDRKSDLTVDRPWYELIASLIASSFNLREISQLPQSQMQRRTEKYQRVAFDLAEVFLFKLNRLSEAFFVLTAFHSHLETHGLQWLWDQRRFDTVLCYLQQAVR